MPVHFVRSGDSMCFECADASGGQIDATATAQTLAALDFERINPLNGPVYVEGAEPGDALKITINRFYPSGQGGLRTYQVSVCWRTSFASLPFTCGATIPSLWGLLFLAIRGRVFH